MGGGRGVVFIDGQELKGRRETEINGWRGKRIEESDHSVSVIEMGMHGD